MPRSMRYRIGFMTLVLLVTTALAVKVGEPAPGFSAVDSHGKMQKLSDYKGKFVVLEWHNQSCPYTKKHYDSGNMQRLQKKWMDKGVIWLTVISSGPGMPGFVTPSQEDQYLDEVHASPTAVLMDPAGTLGRLYDAKTTPEMFIIDPQGTLIYQGAMDDRPSTNQKDIAAAKNYVEAALSEAMASKPVADPVTRPYGCSVKYKHY